MRHLTWNVMRHLCGAALLIGSAPVFAEEIQENATQVEPPRYLPAGSSSAECDTCGSEDSSSDDESDSSSESSESSESSDSSEPSNDDNSCGCPNRRGAFASVASAGLLPQNLQAAPQVFQTDHNGVFLPLVVIGPWGEAIQLKDGSVWTVSPEDTNKIINWVVEDASRGIPGDIIVITPNDVKGSSYRYRLNNQNNGVAVAVNLHLYVNPLYHNVLNHRIIDLDHFLQRVWLEDGTVWDLSWWDYSSRWERGDTIILGINTGSRSSSMPNILINCRLLNHARGHRLY